jgi:hypothetical protein
MEERAVTAERELRAHKLLLTELVKYPRWVSRQGTNDSVEITVSRKHYAQAAALVGHELPPEPEPPASE